MTDRTFRRRRGGLVNLADLDVDDQAAVELRTALTKRRFDVAEQTIARQRDANERMYYLEAAADWKSEAQFLRDWAASGSLNGRLAVAIHGLKHAWNHSTWTHGASDMARFRAEVQAAQSELMAIAKSSPKDASFFFWMIWAARALFDAELARKFYDEAVRRDPTVLANHDAALYTESPSWFGSEDAMMEFARRIAQTGPKGIGADMLIVEAHWMATLDSRNPRWKLPEVREEIVTADARNRQSPATGINLMRSHQWFAYGLWAIGEPALAKQRFAEIGNASIEHPWSSLRFGLDAIFGEFKKARKACMRS